MTDTAPVFEQLKLPGSDLAVQAYNYAADSTAEYVLNHSVRGYVFARAQTEHRGLRPGSDYDDELIFLICVLHDIGLSEQGNGDQRFEVDGADTATLFLRDCGVDEARLEILWDAIALHTSAGIAIRKRPEIALSHLGIGTDIIGLEKENLPAGLADEVHALLPRADLGYALTDDTVAQALANPQKAIPMTFAGELVRRHLPHGAFPEWHGMIAAAGWGDKPTDASAQRRPQSPEELAKLFTEYLQLGDVDGLVSLYEPTAALVPAPGDRREGTDAIRQAIQEMIDNGTRLTLQPRAIRQVGDIALVSNVGTLTGPTPGGEPVTADTTEVVRRQPDGTWAYVARLPLRHRHQRRHRKPGRCDVRHRRAEARMAA